MADEALSVRPIFAAFAFPTAPDARAAFLAAEASPAAVGVWSFRPLDREGYAVAILGEEQDQVDMAAAAAEGAPNCRGNYILTVAEKKLLAHRRYDPLLAAFRRGERIVNSRTSWAAQGGVYMNQKGEVIE